MSTQTDGTLRQEVAYHVYGAYRSGLLGIEPPSEAVSWKYMAPEQQRYAMQVADRIIDAVLAARPTVAPSEPCKWCNDEGVVHTHAGDVIGPCDCAPEQAEERTPTARFVRALKTADYPEEPRTQTDDSQTGGNDV